MTRIADALAERSSPSISFEFFPPKTEDGLVQFHRAVAELAAVDPTFVSVTYGAGGTTRDTTRDLVVQMNAERAFPTMPHLTCMGHTRDQIESLVDDYASHGVENILALAGDPPADGSAPTGDFSFASQLIELIRERGEFSVGVAAFPEGHPRSGSVADDRRCLADKLQSADFAITQFFFDADDYFAMVDDLASLGCDKPVLPGIMPLLNTTTIRRLADMNGAKFPEDLASRIDEADTDDRVAIAVEAAAELSSRLLDGGVPGLHLYCLNRSETVLRILDTLGL